MTLVDLDKLQTNLVTTACCHSPCNGCKETWDQVEEAIAELRLARELLAAAQVTVHVHVGEAPIPGGCNCRYVRAVAAYERLAAEGGAS